NDEDSHGMNVEGDEWANEEDDNELYCDVNINQRRGLQVTQNVEDTHVTLTPVNPDGPQESSSMSSFVSSMLKLLSDVGVESIFTTTSSPIVSLETPTPIMTPSTIATITTSGEAPIPPPTIPSIILENLPTFNSAFRFEERLRLLETSFSEYRQTNQFADAVSAILGIVHQYMDQKMKEAVREAKVLKGLVKNQVKEQVSRILPRIEESVNATLEAEVLIRSSHSSRTSHAIAADLSEMELKKILIEKMEGNKREDDDQEGPSARPNRGSKRQKEGGEQASASTPSEKATEGAGGSTTGSQSRKMSASKSALAEEPVQTTCQMEETSHPVFDTGADDQPIIQTSQHPEWFSQPRRPPSRDRAWNTALPAAQGDAQSWISDLIWRANARSSFNELLDTPIDFFNFIMHRLNVDTLIPDLLAGPTYELIRGSCTSLTELEYHLEEVYKATTDQLDWVNPEGVLDVLTYESDDEEISWKSSEEEDDDENDDDQEDDDNNKEEESFDPLVQTPSHVENTDDEDNDEDSHAPSPANVLSFSLRDLPNFGSLFGFDHRLKTLEANFSKFMQTNQFAEAISSIPGIVDKYIDNRMNEAMKVVVQLQSNRLKDEAQVEYDDFLNKLDENIRKIINEQVKEKVKEQISYVVAANLSELELKKILIDKMENTVTLKRRRDDEDKDKEPSAGSNRGSKRRRARKEPESTSAPKEKTSKTSSKSTEGSKYHHKSASEYAQVEEPMHTTKDLEEPAHQEFDTGATEDQLFKEASQHPDCNLARKDDSHTSFNELMETSLDFSAFVMNQLKVDTLTLEPLPLIPTSRGCRVIPFDHFINNDLEYLSGGVSSRKSTTDDEKIYKFKEGNFNRLRIQDLEDMLLLLVQGKLTNLTVDECLAFNVSLRMSTRSIVIKRRMEDLQLGVESYQKNLNLTKPDTYRSDLKRKEAYTTYSNPRGFIYQNKDKQNRLMRIDELHNFNDETLNDVRTALDDRLKEIQIQYLPQAIWRRSDKDRVADMI
nr:hypothetical protein [Tanacetum cinerariifolium]